MQFNLQRFVYEETGTVGILTADEFEAPVVFTIERPWLNNKINVSCILAGNYTVERIPIEGGVVYRLLGVHGRSGINIHVANKYRDLKGCIGLGLDLTHHYAGYKGLYLKKSKKAFEIFNEITSSVSSFKIQVSDSPALIDWVKGEKYEILAG